MTKAKVMLWAIGLFVGSIIWALLISTAIGGVETGSFSLQMALALGLGGPVFLITGVIAGIVYFFKRSPSAAMWTWTVLLLVTLVALGIGGTKQAGVASPQQGNTDSLRLDSPKSDSKPSLTREKLLCLDGKPLSALSKKQFEDAHRRDLLTPCYD